MKENEFVYIQQVYEGLNQSTVAVGILSVVKVLAVGFLIFNFVMLYWKDSAENTQRSSTAGLSFSSLSKYIISVLLVLFSTQILSFLDSFLLLIDQKFIEISPPNMPIPLANYSVEEVDSDGWDLLKTAGLKLLNPLGFVYEFAAFVITFLVWLLDLFIFPLFLAERFFLLMVMRVFFPVVITFSVLEKFQDLQIRFYKLYIGVWLIVPALFLVNIFINKTYEVFPKIFNTSGGTDNMNDTFLKLGASIFILLLKFKLYSVARNHVLKMFS